MNMRKYLVLIISRIFVTILGAEAFDLDNLLSEFQDVEMMLWFALNLFEMGLCCRVGLNGP